MTASPWAFMTGFGRLPAMLLFDFHDEPLCDLDYLVTLGCKSSHALCGMLK
jgi:hypothetical protein